MRPAFVLLGFLFGSAAAITFSLAGVMIVFALLRSDHPRLDTEFGPLRTHLGLFVTLTLVAGLSFYAEHKRPAWRWAAFVGLAVSLLGVLFFYWPDE
jgi:hypothetical protein